MSRIQYFFLRSDASRLLRIDSPSRILLILSGGLAFNPPIGGMLDCRGVSHRRNSSDRTRKFQCATGCQPSLWSRVECSRHFHRAGACRGSLKTARQVKAKGGPYPLFIYVRDFKRAVHRLKLGSFQRQKRQRPRWLPRTHYAEQLVVHHLVGAKGRHVRFQIDRQPYTVFRPQLQPGERTVVRNPMMHGPGQCVGKAALDIRRKLARWHLGRCPSSPTPDENTTQRPKKKSESENRDRGVHTSWKDGFRTGHTMTGRGKEILTGYGSSVFYTTTAFINFCWYPCPPP